MTPQKIVITGGPSTGKTSLIDALEKNGHHCFHEVIRLMTLEAKHKGELDNFTTNPIATVADPMNFNNKIIQARLAQHRDASNIDAQFVFFDRGIPDVLAYMNYFKQAHGQVFRDIAQKNRYDTIFLLPIWKEIYVSDNERFESFDEGMAIHRHLKETYTELGYTVIEVPKDTIENRVKFIVNQFEAS